MSDPLLGGGVAQRTGESLHPEPTAIDGEGVTRKADAPLDVILHDVHLYPAPVVGMREIEDQHVVAPYPPEPRKPADLRLLLPERPVQVEYPGPDGRLPHQHEITLPQRG